MAARHTSEMARRFRTAVVSMGCPPWLLGGLCTRPVSGRLREVFNIRCALTHTGTHKRGFSASF